MSEETIIPGPEQAAALLAETAGLDTLDFLVWGLRRFGSGLSFATSLGPEDQVLLQLLDGLLADLRLPSYTLEVFTLDTGRLHQATHRLLQANRERFRLPVRLYFPEAQAVEELVSRQGTDGFYGSVEARKACCAARKVAPLKRALAGRVAWITGQRRAQALSRTGLERIEWDAAHGLWKLNPLADWSQERVQDYSARHGIPQNELLAQGFPSIGCEPCTRAIQPGEDERAGRWWWEAPEHKECGLHVQDPVGAKRLAPGVVIGKL